MGIPQTSTSPINLRRRIKIRPLGLRSSVSPSLSTQLKILASDHSSSSNLFTLKPSNFLLQSLQFLIQKSARFLVFFGCSSFSSRGGGVCFFRPVFGSRTSYVSVAFAIRPPAAVGRLAEPTESSQVARC